MWFFSYALVNVTLPSFFAFITQVWTLFTCCIIELCQQLMKVDWDQLVKGDEVAHLMYGHG